MKSLNYTVALAVVLAIAPLRQAAGQGASEESLIRAWEAQQAGDPKNQVFERIAPRRYRFQTSYFPFAGELRIINVIIQEYPGGSMQGWQSGTVEVELLNVPEDFEKKFSRSFSVWENKNRLHYNPERNEWISSNEFMKAFTKRMNGFSWPPALLNNLFVIVLIILIVLLSLLSKRTQKRINKSIERNMAAQEKLNADVKRSRQLSESAIKLQAESNRLLAEILQVLKNNSRR